MLWSSQFTNAVSVRVSAVVGLRGGLLGFVQMASSWREEEVAVSGRESGKRAGDCREVSGEEEGSKCGLSEDDEVVDGRQPAKAVEGEL